MSILNLLWLFPFRVRIRGDPRIPRACEVEERNSEVTADGKDGRGWWRGEPDGAEAGVRQAEVGASADPTGSSARMRNSKGGTEEDGGNAYGTPCFAKASAVAKPMADKTEGAARNTRKVHHESLEMHEWEKPWG